MISLLVSPMGENVTGTVSYGFPLEYDEAANSLTRIPLPLETFIM